MTKLLYQRDSYMRTFEAIVIKVDADNHAFVLDQSAFYPGGGGQPADQGIIKCCNLVYNVQRAKKVGDEVLHFISGELTLPNTGTKVIGEIDWEKRYKLMRTHTAMHILCGVIFRDYGATVTGGDMEPLKGRMDFEFETMHKDLVEAIQEAVNKEIAQSRPIRVDILPREEAFKIPDLIRTKINLLPAGINQVRVVEIQGLDLQADGGTHVQNTQEVGHMRIVDYKSKGRINKRIYVELDD
jgi:misacylated tRNA(Ala) deacylase